MSEERKITIKHDLGLLTYFVLLIIAVCIGSGLGQIADAIRYASPNGSGPVPCYDAETGAPCDSEKEQGTNAQS